VTYGGRVRPVLILLMASLTAAAGTLVAGPAQAQPTPLEPFYDQELDWDRCAAGQCAWLTVPLDYSDPTGDTLRLRVSRTASTGEEGARLGSLVVNPGGPGVEGIAFASALSDSLAPDITDAYDIVGFDPRGVGQSSPVVCMSGAETTRWFRTDSTPDTPTEQATLMRRARALAGGCLDRTPVIARHLGTEDTVRDMDILRQALGDERLAFLGFSYGTVLAAQYAEQFPDRVGRFVLDGAVDPRLDLMQISRDQSQGFQLALQRFAQNCAARSSCPWKGGAPDVLAGLNGLLGSLDQRPLPAGPGRSLVQAEAITSVFFAMYSPTLWGPLRQALRQATRGIGQGLALLFDAATDRLAPDRYATNMASAFPAISCWDSPATPAAPGLAAAAEDWSQRAPVPELARAMSWSNVPCSVWFGRSSERPAAASSTTTAPMLIIGGAYDPATPYRWSRALNRQLPTSTLLTYQGDGHTIYNSGSSCVDSIVDTYLLTGVLPPAGASCR
jgi:pimeloyl-ACP methyl ester carboxylesterase